MLIVGLTGGIGCGKSTVRELLGRVIDTRTFDCDEISKRILFSPDFVPVAERILGRSAFIDGQPDTKRIAQIIFGDAERKTRFERLLHPLVRQAMKVAKEQAEQDGIKLFVVESAIMFESRLSDLCDVTVCATCGAEEQLRRLTAIRQMTIEEIQARQAQQMPDSERQLQANILIGTDCSLEALRRRVGHLHTYLIDLELRFSAH
ncbi:dephospho-CoA kinase [Patescibacteria group bacterium]|nr:dephospho-CoA kinase [Patescibacteria group bacterium]